MLLLCIIDDLAWWTIILMRAILDNKASSLRFYLFNLIIHYHYIRPCLVCPFMRLFSHLGWVITWRPKCL